MTCTGCPRPMDVHAPGAEPLALPLRRFLITIPPCWNCELVGGRASKPGTDVLTATGLTQNEACRSS